jgi:hypothetical protein
VLYFLRQGTTCLISYSKYTNCHLQLVDPTGLYGSRTRVGSCIGKDLNRKHRL